MNHAIFLVFRESLEAELEREVFGHNGEHFTKPALTVKEYTEQCEKLGGVVGSLEQNIKKLLKDYDGKKKVCSLFPWGVVGWSRSSFLLFCTGIASKPTAGGREKALHTLLHRASQTQPSPL